jgi:hydrogenase expression/formation protein HypD
MSDERALAASLVARIERTTARIGRPVNLMEVCGTHTVELRRQGIHSLLPRDVRLISGPGCPVCVTPTGYIDNAIRLITEKKALVASFGDMLKVPGSDSVSLSAFTGSGAVRLLYSPHDLVALAEAHSGPVVFLAIGFETTTPTIVSALMEARERGLRNVFLYTAFKTVPAALTFLLSEASSAIDGFILPGHVSVIIGEKAYTFLANEGGRPGVITGFEALDMLSGILMLLLQIEKGERRVENAYTRAVRGEGNPRAQRIVEETLEPRSETWRGLGIVPDAALGLKPSLADSDAAVAFALPPAQDAEPAGCLCGSVIAGKASPLQCPLFGRRCQPDMPVGPCMVSSEGTCAAYFRFGADR